MSKKLIKKTLFSIMICSMLMLVIIPLLYFLTLSFSSSKEVNSTDKRIFPTFSLVLRITKIEEIGVLGQPVTRYSIERKVDNVYLSETSTNNPTYLEDYYARYYSVEIDGQIEIERYAELDYDTPTTFIYQKNMLYNFKAFFTIMNNGTQSLLNSVYAALLTVIISLSIGSMAGYALARYRFKGKDQIGVILLVVRMFPIVTITISMVVFLITIGLYDTVLGLAIIYSLPNIALTAWITSSIFQGINRELEEASYVFGASKFMTFLRITLPLALPALAASSMYACLTAWNDTITALILTNNNQTLALSIYKIIGGNSGDIQYAAAGSIILIIPALIFIYLVKDYINQMWGEVKV